MKKIAIQLFTCVFLLLFLVQCKPGLNNNSEGKPIDASFQIHRGVNISHWLSQSDRRGGAREEFFTEKDVQLIANLGFDHIRLPIDEEQMWYPTGEMNDTAFALLHDALGWCKKAGLRTVVDLHILRSHHFNAEEIPLWNEPAEQDQFVGFWGDLSAELIDYPVSMVAYELMNEAVAEDHDQWNRLAARAIEKIRVNEPNRNIVVGSNRWQSVDTFDELKVPENDTNIILSFHFYIPFNLTHYTASWTPLEEYTGPVQYPGQIIEEEDIGDLPPGTLEAIGWDNGYWTIDSLAKEIEKPLTHARKLGLSLYCGEWGCLPAVPRENRLAWYEDVHTILERKNIPWATWDYQGGFGIVDPKTKKVDKELVNILTGK